jgi:hypothetical protein
MTSHPCIQFLCRPARQHSTELPARRKHLICVNEADKLVAFPVVYQTVPVDILLWPFPAPHHMCHTGGRVEIETTIRPLLQLACTGQASTVELASNAYLVVRLPKSTCQYMYSTNPELM